jgi:hypothetical protein
MTKGTGFMSAASDAAARASGVITVHKYKPAVYE